MTTEATIDYLALARERKAARAAANSPVLIPVFDLTKPPQDVVHGEYAYKAGTLNGFGLARLNDFKSIGRRKLQDEWVINPDTGMYVFADDEDEANWGVAYTYLVETLAYILAGDLSCTLSFQVIESWGTSDEVLTFLMMCKIAVLELNPILDPNYLQKMAGKAQPESRKEDGTPLNEKEAAEKN